VLQVFRSSLFPRREGLPEELDREAEMPYPLSSGPAFQSSFAGVRNKARETRIQPIQV